jgi:dipeptidase E
VGNLIGMAEQQIVAMGGGGTSAAVLAEVFALAGPDRARLLYVGTASAEDPRNALIMYERARGQAEVTPLKFFPWPPAGLRELTLAQDVIFVGGGSTANMLAIWRVHGFDRILREAWEQGIVLSGSSAGMICWFEASVTDSFGPQLAAMRDGLGFLPGSACPHYDDEELRRPFYRDAVERGFPAGYAADSGVGLHFVGTELVEVISPREGATGYRVERGVEIPLPARSVS